ncbi:hypothetical protein [Endosaccharibacter trunci]
MKDVLFCKKEPKNFDPFAAETARTVQTKQIKSFCFFFFRKR